MSSTHRDRAFRETDSLEEWYRQMETYYREYGVMVIEEFGGAIAQERVDFESELAAMRAAFERLTGADLRGNE